MKQAKGMRRMVWIMVIFAPFTYAKELSSNNKHVEFGELPALTTGNGEIDMYTEPDKRKSTSHNAGYYASAKEGNTYIVQPDGGVKAIKVPVLTEGNGGIDLFTQGQGGAHL